MGHTMEGDRDREACPMSFHMPDESVTYCHACSSNRLCREYRGYWICLKRCWRKRKVLVTYWVGQASKEEERSTT